MRRDERRLLTILGLSVWLGIAHVTGCSDSGDADDDKAQAGSLLEIGIDDGASEGASAEATVALDKETTLSLKTGAEVKIAAGSTTKELTVSLSRPPDKEALAFVKSTDKKLASAPYVITPHGQAFDKQVEVTLPVSGQVNTDKVQVMYLADEKDRDWKVVGKPQVSAGKAKIMLDHFSVLLLVEESGGVVAMPQADAGAMSGDPCDRCPEGQVCGGDGLRECVPAPVACALIQCGGPSSECGELADGCGGVLNCGDCPDGQTCGASGVPNRCGSGGSACVPTACTPGTCGLLADGCGGTLDCGTDCPAGESCGGGGVPSVCGAPPCVPLTCPELAAECGTLDNGCGTQLDCGACSGGMVCGLLVPNECAACTPMTISVACAGKCGSVGDGCGGTFTCNAGNGGVDCSMPLWCGGSGVPNECGGPA
jgi:hypothetical protein